MQQLPGQGVATLKMELERADRSYTSGQRLRGEVHVACHHPMQVNGLHLHIGWRVEGKGEREEEIVGQILLAQGPWQPGQHYAYPFEFELPHGPYSYQGFVHQLAWFVEVSLPPMQAVLDFHVLPPQEVATLAYAPRQSMVRHDPFALADSEHTGLIVSIIMSGIGIVLLGAGAAVLFIDIVGGVILVLTTALFFVLAAAFMVPALRRKMAERKTGPIEVACSPEQLAPGAHLHCTMRFQPRGTLKLNRAYVTITCREIAVDDHGTSSSTHTHELFRQDYPLLEASQLLAGRPLDLRVIAVVPPDAPLSFETKWNKLSWLATFYLDIESWPDWTAEWTFSVIPGTRDRPAALTGQPAW